MTCTSIPKSSSSRTTASTWSSTITEGGKTGVKSIEFIGNTTYSSYRLKDIIKTRESNLLSFLGGGDVYDPDRVEADRDLIRRFYLKHGFADVQVVAALTEYDPEQKGFLVTFKIEEGQQYRVGSVNFQSSIPTLDGNALRSFSRVSVGSLYNAEALEKSVEEMQIEASRRGYAFAIVRPRGDRNFESHTVSIIFAIDEGPRTYIERINMRGNTRTRDYVIRREFDIAEGDAYNRALVDRAERRLKNLDFFKSVKITTEPGSSSDRVILDVDLEEKSTGDFSVSGGYSTTDGALAEVSISERNFLGRGLFAQGLRDLWPVCARLFAVVRRALSPGLPRGARPRPVLAPATAPTAISRTAPRRWASARGSASRCARICRCSCAIRSISRKCRCRAIWPIVTTIRPIRCLPSTRRRPGSAQTGPRAAIGPGRGRYYRASACGATATARPRCRCARNWRAAAR